MRFLSTGLQRILAGLVLTQAIISGCVDSNSGSGSTSSRPIELIPAPSTVVITTPPSTTSTTTTIVDVSGVDFVWLAREQYGNCGEWHDLAISVGFTEDEWPLLSRIMFRESRCQPDACSKSTSGLKCRDAGLVQVNQIHREWLSQMGWSFPEDMFVPENNLRFAKALKDSSGWSPWAWLGLD
jgi:hypothetical protein